MTLQYIVGNSDGEFPCLDRGNLDDYCPVMHPTPTIQLVELEGNSELRSALRLPVYHGERSHT